VDKDHDQEPGFLHISTPTTPDNLGLSDSLIMVTFRGIAAFLTDAGTSPPPNKQQHDPGSHRGAVVMRGAANIQL